jgi:putative transposase
MPRRPRLSTGGLAYHVLNRRVGRLPLFDKPADYAAFEKILAEAHKKTGFRIAAYCLMPNHWHLLSWPRTDGELPTFRGHAVDHCDAHTTVACSSSHVGDRAGLSRTFKSFPVQTDEHFLTVARYVERNAVRAALVTRAEEWQWSSL